VHGATLALGATGVFAEHLCHQVFGIHADGDAVTVDPIGRDGVIVGSEQGNAANGDGLLTFVEVQESADFPLLVGAETACLEVADAHHVGEQPHFFFVIEALVYFEIGQLANIDFLPAFGLGCRF